MAHGTWEALLYEYVPPCFNNVSCLASVGRLVGRLSRGYIYLYPSRPSHFLILRWLQPSSRGFP
jgi:hypothetical protein